MSKVITFDKGSRRRLNQVRWKMVEIYSLVLLALFVLAMSGLVMFWEVYQEQPYSEPIKFPQVRDAQPTAQ